MTSCRMSWIVSLAAAALIASHDARAQNAYQPPQKLAYARVMDGEVSLNVLVPKGKANGLGVIVVASGAGSGHGVGLCQTGALGMARAGKSAEAILEHYYRGIELRRLY